MGMHTSVVADDSYSLLSDGRIIDDHIALLCPEKMHIASITYESDVVLQESEFFYLLGFSVGDSIEKHDITDAVSYLSKKNKFSSLTVIKKLSDDGVSLHFVFVGLWTVHKVSVKGVFQGRARFEQCYVMRCGEVFDKEKHNHSLEKIREMLIRDGYYHCIVKSNFLYNHSTKEITIVITINKGKQFSFGQMDVCIVADETVEDKESIKKQIKKRLSRRLSSYRYNRNFLEKEARSLKKYCERSGFLQTNIQLIEKKNYKRFCVDLVWTVAINHKREFVFFGNRFFSKKELLEKLLNFGHSALLLPAQILSSELLNEYKAKGFWHAEIMVQEEKGRSIFIIKEGLRAVIKAVEIRDVRQSDTTHRAHTCFGHLLKRKYYDSQEYAKGVDLLLQHYCQEGFLSCSIVGHTYEPDKLSHEYTLIIHVDEGQQNFVQSVVVENYNELVLQGPFGKIANQIERIPFTMSLLEEQRSWLFDYFQKTGYMRPRIKSSLEKNGENVSIVWTVEPGEKVCFGKTVVLGSMTFPFKSFMSLLSYKNGELWSQEKIRQTFKSLKSCEIFDSIALTPDYSDASHEKTMIVKAHLDDPYEVRLRAGLELQHVRKYQTFNGVTYKLGGTGFIKNPFNVGDQLRLDVDCARSHREIIGRYKRPFFSSIPLLGVMQVYSISYDQPGFIGSTNDIYTLVQNGFFMSLQHKAQFFDVVCNGGCEWMKTSVKNKFLQESLGRAIDFQPQLLDQTIPFFFIEPTFIFEYCDNLFNPRSGALSLLSLKGMIPFEQKYNKTFFFKFLAEQSVFMPLYSAVLALRVRLGHIFYREFSAIMPSERFYLGGSHSLRGYEADLAPPLGLFVDEDDESHVVPRGGKSMANLNLEIRFPVYGKMGAVVFQDFGVLSSSSFIHVKHDHLLGASGFGLRFLTPLGPLRFDIGWRWKKYLPIERSFAWFLTFGQAF